MTQYIVWYFDIIILLGIGTICIIGVFARCFNDNIFQRSGMAILTIMSWGRAKQVYELGIDQEIFVWLHVGMFLFALGTAWKFFLRKYWGTFDWEWRKLYHFPYDRRGYEERRNIDDDVVFVKSDPSTGC